MPRNSQLAVPLLPQHASLVVVCDGVLPDLESAAVEKAFGRGVPNQASEQGVSIFESDGILVLQRSQGALFRIEVKQLIASEIGHEPVRRILLAILPSSSQFKPRSVGINYGVVMLAPTAQSRQLLASVMDSTVARRLAGGGKRPAAVELRLQTKIFDGIKNLKLELLEFANPFPGSAGGMSLDFNYDIPIRPGSGLRSIISLHNLNLIKNDIEATVTRIARMLE